MTATEWGNAVAWVAAAANVAIMFFNAWQLRKIRRLRARIAEYEAEALAQNAKLHDAVRALARSALLLGVPPPDDSTNDSRPAGSVH